MSTHRAPVDAGGSLVGSQPVLLPIHIKLGTRDPVGTQYNT
jgi:hypothetical protein